MVEEEQLNKMPEIKGDEVAKMGEEELIDMLEKDIVAYKKQMKALDEELINYVAQLEIDEEIWALISDPKTYKRTQLDWEFEKNPRYWDLQFKKSQFKLRQSQAQARGTKEHIEFQIKAVKKDYEDKVEKLKELKGEKNE